MRSVTVCDIESVTTRDAVISRRQYWRFDFSERADSMKQESRSKQQKERQRQAKQQQKRERRLERSRAKSAKTVERIQ